MTATPTTKRPEPDTEEQVEAVRAWLRYMNRDPRWRAIRRKLLAPVPRDDSQS